MQKLLCFDEELKEELLLSEATESSGLAKQPREESTQRKTLGRSRERVKFLEVVIKVGNGMIFQARVYHVPYHGSSSRHSGRHSRSCNQRDGIQSTKGQAHWPSKRWGG